MTSELVDLPARFGLDRPAFDRLGRRRPGELRRATSVVLVRDGTGGVEVFLLERAAEMAFAAGMSVFPGGGVDPGDREALAAGLVDEGAAAVAARTWTTTPEDAAALLCCAVRETFEETGVLLAGRRSEAELDPSAPAPLPPPGARERLVAREIALGDALGGARLDVDRLRPWARWITPEAMPRRYDTCFFLAAVPPGQEPDGTTSEAVGAAWCAQGDALREWEDGRRALMPPTWAVLSEIAAAEPTVAALLDVAGERRPQAVTPRFRPADDRVGLAVPAHALGAVR